MLNTSISSFTIKLNNILSKAAAEAFKSTIKSTGITDIDNQVSIEMENTATKFGQTFASEASADLAKSIMEFIQNADITIIHTPTFLTSFTGGPVSGQLTITPLNSKITIS